MPNKQWHTNQFKRTEMLNIVGYASFNNDLWTQYLCERRVFVYLR